MLTLLLVELTYRVPLSTVRSAPMVAAPLTLIAPVPVIVRLLFPVILRPPVIVSPVFSTLSEAAPVKEAVIVPAAKSPLVSLITADLSDAVETILEELNATLPAFQIMLLLTLSSFSFRTLNSRLPDPSVALPPSAMMAAL